MPVMEERVIRAWHCTRMTGEVADMLRDGIQISRPETLSCQRAYRLRHGNKGSEAGQITNRFFQQHGRIPDPSCLIPRFDGAILSQAWKEALWDKFVTGAPRQRTPSELQYSDPLPGRVMRSMIPRGASFARAVK
jgi:hypothetical protein